MIGFTEIYLEFMQDCTYILPLKSKIDCITSNKTKKRMF